MSSDTTHPTVADLRARLVGRLVVAELLEIRLEHLRVEIGWTWLATLGDRRRVAGVEDEASTPACTRMSRA